MYFHVYMGTGRQRKRDGFGFLSVSSFLHSCSLQIEKREKKTHNGSARACSSYDVATYATHRRAYGVASQPTASLSDFGEEMHKSQRGTQGIFIIVRYS